MADIDLALLRTFTRVYETGSFTRAADQMDVSQPTVSYAIGRLRRQLADDLFVRGPGGIRPTDVAETLYRGIAPALRTVDGAVDQVRTFDPSRSRRRFRLSLTDLGEMAILSPILELLAREAPGVELDVVPMDVAHVRSWLLTGQVELAIATLSLGPDLASERILVDRYVCLMRSGHRLADGPLTVDDFRSARHVVVTEAVGHRTPDEEISRLGIDREISVRVPRFGAIASALERTDLVAVVPGAVARAHQPGGLLVGRPLPFEVPDSVVRLWRRRQTTTPPAVEWLRDLVVRAARTIQRPAPAP